VDKTKESVDIFVVLEILLPTALDFASLAQNFRLNYAVEDFVCLEITIQYMLNVTPLQRIGIILRNKCQSETASQSEEMKYLVHERL
jgi:hypothetical protein